VNRSSADGAGNPSAQRRNCSNPGEVATRMGWVALGAVGVVVGAAGVALGVRERTVAT
jgi:hypothetical protein